MVFGAKKEDLTPGQIDPKGTQHTHHQNTFLDILSENPRFSG